MGPAEVAHRVLEAALKAAFRNDRKGWDRFAFADGTAVGMPKALCDRLLALPEPAVARCISASAGMVLKRAFSMLGHDWPAASENAPIDWLLDPVSGGRWEGAERYCFDVDHRHVTGRGDVKLVWELNRLQFLPWLAFQPDPAKSPVGDPWIVLASWMDSNPPFRGVNWNSGIELTMRIVSVALALAASPQEPDEASRCRIARFMAAHGFWLARYPSLHSSANNHLIAEGLGLFVASVVCPDLPDAVAWRREGRAILERETLLQFTADGVGVEQSPTYTAFSAEMISLGVVIGDAAGQPLSGAVVDRLALVASWLRAMMDRTGHLPRIGDDDEGRVVAALPDREPRYVASVVAALAGVTGRSDLLPPARDPHPRDLVFGSLPGSVVPTAGLQVFRQGGYSVVRECEEGGRELLLAFDHGPLGYLSIAAHGHSDTLAVWLHLDGRPILVDAGTYLYHAAGPWRGAFCGTAAHNTLRLGVDSSTQTGPFLWSHKARGCLHDAHDGAHWTLAGSHDGFVGRFGVTHVRRVSREEGAIVIEDRLEGDLTPRPVSLSLLFHPNLVVTRNDGLVRVADGDTTVLNVSCDVDFSVEIVRGDESRRLGWYSPAFGSRVPASQLVMTGVMTVGTPVRTTLQLGV